MIAHLFNSRVRVEEMKMTRDTAGHAVMDWAQATDPDPEKQALLESLPCRIDLNFLRPGKDQPAAPAAGVKPDRIGVMFTYPYAPIKAGQRIVTIPDALGREPVHGTFDLRVPPDEAIDYSQRHHLEVQVVETTQTTTDFDIPELT